MWCTAQITLQEKEQAKIGFKADFYQAIWQILQMILLDAVNKSISPGKVRGAKNAQIQLKKFPYLVQYWQIVNGLLTQGRKEMATIYKAQRTQCKW